MNQAGKKYATVAQDVRVRVVRPATREECEGERGWVVVELASGCTLEGASQFLASGVVDARRLLTKVDVKETP